MAANNATQQSLTPRLTFDQRAKQAGLSILFAILPTIRSLRGRMWVWSGIRLGTAAVATALVWRYRHAGAGIVSLLCGLLLFAFALLVRAKPEAVKPGA